MGLDPGVAPAELEGPPVEVDGGLGLDPAAGEVPGADQGLDGPVREGTVPGV